MLQTRNGKRSAAGHGADRLRPGRRGAAQRAGGAARPGRPGTGAPAPAAAARPAAAPTRRSPRGVNASPGAAVGAVVFEADEAERRGSGGEAVILVRDETTPDDLHGMIQAQGVLTARGGKTSHAAIVAVGMGKPAVCGVSTLDIDVQQGILRVGGQSIAEGDVITIDGTGGRGPARRPAPGRPGPRQPLPDPHPVVGRRRPPTRRAHQRGQPRGRRAAPGASAPRASGSAAPSTCSRPRTGCRSSRR